MKNAHYYFFLVMLLVGCGVQAQTINTLAGNGTAGYNGDGGAANACELYHPFGIATHDGTLYVADRANNCIRAVALDGSKVTTIAGTGTAGYNGDNIAATAAQLNSPIGVSVDDTGAVYISDQGNNRVRIVDPNGTIRTFAGNGTSGNGGDNGPATAAQLNTPRGIIFCTLTGSVYIADQGNDRVRKVDNGVIKNFAGNGVLGYSGDNGPATAASLNGPYAVAFFGPDIFISDVDNERVRIVVNDTIRTYAGNGTEGYNGDNIPATAAQLNEPIGLAAGNGGIYIADGWNGRVRHVNSSGTISTIAGNGTLGYSGDGGPAINAQLNDPYGLARDQEDNLYIADYSNNRIRYLAHPTAAVQAVAASLSSLKVTPNPTSGTFTTTITAERDEELQMAITNVTGQVVEQLRGMTNKAMAWDMDVPDGVYILSATAGPSVWHRQIVISR